MGGTYEAFNAGTGARFRTKTDSDGRYTIRAIPIGIYTVVAEASGFNHFETRGVRLQVNEVAGLDFTVAMGTTLETVTVAGQAVSVDTTTRGHSAQRGLYGTAAGSASSIGSGLGCTHSALV